MCKRVCLSFFLLAAVHMHAQTPTPAADAASGIAELQKSSQSAKETIAADREKWLAALDTWYATSLDALFKDRTKAGDLDGAVAVKAERDRVAAHSDPTPEQMSTMPAALRTLRSTYDTNLLRVLGEVARRTMANNQKLMADLEMLQKNLTKAGKIDEAIQVKSERERVAAEIATKPSPAPVAASAPPAPAPAPSAPAPAPAAAPAVAGEEAEEIHSLVPKHREIPIVIKGKERVTTERKFKPPVEITMVAKTDNTDLRIGYAANQIIFNWQNNPTEFRIDGGPAAGKHKPGAGQIPKDQFVTIRWRVTPKKQSIFVDGELRYEHEGDYSMIDNPITVFTLNSTVTVKSIKVRKLPAEAE